MTTIAQNHATRPPATQSARILIVEDERAIGAAVTMLLDHEGYETIWAETVDRGIELARDGDLDLVITDLRLGTGSGLDVIRAVRDLGRDTPVILMTSFSSMESAIESLRLGAVDYVIKPFDNIEFVHAVTRALTERHLRRENAILKRTLKKSAGHQQIIGHSVAIKHVLDLVRRVAPSDANVLIQGESGTGKELVAQAIHADSTRAAGPFVAVNCGAIPAELIESELFGHAKGAFTGAIAAAEGLVREARNGTLFLDEIGELPLALQVKFLRVLQDRQVRAVGAKEVVRVDVRFLAATNKDLKREVERGNFREDLYYRLNVVNIKVPPLRERGEDIQLLSRHFIAHHAQKLRRQITGIDQAFADFLANYQWPGNVRELENLIERAVILADTPILAFRDLAENAPASRVPSPSPPDANGPMPVERYIQQMVLRYQDTCSEVDLAKMLGIGRKALWVRRRRWGLTRPVGPRD